PANRVGNRLIACVKMLQFLAIPADETSNAINNGLRAHSSSQCTVPNAAISPITSASMVTSATAIIRARVNWASPDVSFGEGTGMADCYLFFRQSGLPDHAWFG